MSKKKYNEITLLKMLALASVLFFHCYRPFMGSGSFWKVTIDSTVSGLEYLYHFNKVFDVHCLFFCSGFLYFMTMTAGNRTVWEQLIRRVKRIVVPYLSVGLLFTVPLYLSFHLPSGQLTSNASWFEGYWLFITMQFSDHLWFLQIMLIITVICLLLNGMIKKYFWLLLAGSFLLTFGFNRWFSDIRYMSLCSMSDNLFLFILGGAAFRCNELFTSWKNLVIMAVSGIMFLVSYNLSSSNALVRETLSILADGSVCVCALALFKLFADKVMPVLYQLSAIQYFDRNFMGFYMYHMPFPLICATLLYEPFHRIIPSDWLYIVTAWVITVVLTAVSVKVASLIKAQCTKVGFIAKLYN
jgi:hypothetical protein